jgi:hypothetical protein
MNVELKLKRWAERELQRNLDHLILEDDDGGLLAFGSYDIQRRDSVITVCQNSELLGEFGSRRVALSWCVAHHRNLYDFTQQIQVLDRQQRRLHQDLENENRRCNRAKNNWLHELITYKMQNKQQYLKNIENELEKCVRRAKYLQLRGSYNETARTRIP